MKYRLYVWDSETDFTVEPIMEADLILDEEVDTDVINVVESNLRVGFQILCNKSIIVEIERRSE